MELIEGFKKSEMGLIPADWEIKKLGELTKLTNGYAFSSDFYSDAGPILLTPGNFKLDGGLYFNKRNTLRYCGTTNKSMQFKKGDLLIVMTDLTPGCNLLGKPGFVNTDEVVLHNQRIGKITVFNKIVTSKYLYWFFVSELFSKRMKDTATGSTVRHTSVGSINNSFIPLPPTLIEQDLIATALSDTDALIGSLEKLIAKKKAIKQGTMQQLLTGKKRLPGFSGKWEVKKLGELVVYKNGKSFESAVDKNGEFSLITLNSIGIDGKLKPEHLRVNESDNSLERGDLIIVLSDVAHGNFLGLTDVIPESKKYVLNQRMGALKKLNQVTSTFLSYYINHNQLYFKMMGKGSSQQNLGKYDILNFELNLPSVNEQVQIATVLKEIDAEISLLVNKQSKYKSIKQGMMQELLTGKTRLV